MQFLHFLLCLRQRVCLFELFECLDLPYLFPLDNVCFVLPNAPVLLAEAIDENYPYEEIIAPLLQDLNTPVFLANLHKHGVSEKLNGVFNLVADEEVAEKVIVPVDIQALADQRWQAKQEKNWELSDSLRNQIEEK